MPSPIKREHHFGFFYVLAAFLALMFVQDYLSGLSGSVQTLPYSQFETC